MCLHMLIISALYTILSLPGHCNLFTLQEADEYPLYLPVNSGLPFCSERFIEETVVFAHEHERLRLRFGFDGGYEVHAQLSVEHTFGH